MSQALKNLLTLLNLKKIEEGPFHGQNEDLGLRRVFGGRIVGQASHAAKKTALNERLVHSFRSYFLRPGDSRKSTIYDIETLRDSNSFNARRVSAIQNGKLIFYMATSFQAPEAGSEYQKTMPSVPAPDGLPSEMQIARSLAHLLLPVLKDKFVSDRPFEVRPVEFYSPPKGHVAEPHHQVQIRTGDSVPDDLRIHQYLLGYASDLSFLSVASQPHDIGFLEPGVQIVTIDHSMWFHHPFSLNKWLLYSAESTSASGACGFVCGESHTQDDVLVASTVQEEVMHNHN